MDATEVILCRPPLTTNNLDATQRARLIHSTRKLGAILGTTPRLVEHEVEPIRVSFLPIGRTSTDSTYSSSSSTHEHMSYNIPHVRHPHTQSCPSPTNTKGVYSSSSASSSVSSFIDVLPIPKSFSSRPRRSAEAPRPLVLRLNPVVVDAIDVRISTSKSPLLTAASLCHSPVTPTVPMTPTKADIRRKRMAKLARTFGENVPPEMVFRSLPTPASGPAPRPRYPTGACIEPPPRRSSRVWMTGSKCGTWVGEWNRRDIQEVQQKLRTLKVR